MTTGLLTTAALLAASAGLLAWMTQWLCTLLMLRRPALQPQRWPGISILKPLCGVDDCLQLNLEQFAHLDYPDYEVLLGVKDALDPAYALACEVAARWPERLRVVLQRGAPGYNPKVNQLLTLTRAARHELLVVSDSNVRVPDGYLSEIAALLEDDAVGLVTHPVVGVGERTLGSLFDNMYMSTAISSGVLGAKCLTGVGVVVGKSMALRRRELSAIGGFEALKDVLAEDYVAGQRIAQLGKAVVLARLPVMNVSESRTLEAFFARFARWGTMQRKAVGNAAYLCQLLLNPLFFFGLAALLSPGFESLAILLCAALFKALLEESLGRALGRPSFGWRGLSAVLLKDAVVFCAWLAGLLSDEVTWRGKRLRVRPGTRLVPAPSGMRLRLWLRRIQPATRPPA